MECHEDFEHCFLGLACFLFKPLSRGFDHFVVDNPVLKNRCLQCFFCGGSLLCSTET